MRPTPDERRQFEAQAQQFAQTLGELPHADLIQRMLASVLRMSHDSRRADLKIATAALEEMEHSFDILEMYYERRKVSIFGSARTQQDEPIYQQIKQLARALTLRNYMVITGAGPGVMAAGNEGAGREHSFGMSIRLPQEYASNRFISGDEKDIHFKYFFTRKLAFLKDSHAVVLAPGGFGTHDEGFETLTLIQTGKAQLMPLVCLAPEGNTYWAEWESFVRQTLLAQGMISEHDLHLFKITHSVEEACDEVCRFYSRYHSLRFHRGELVLRLTQTLTEAELDELNQDFSDLVTEGHIQAGPSPSGEQYDPSLEELPSVRLNFKLGAFGRLRQMIDRINSWSHETACPQVPPERGEGGRMPAEIDEAVEI